MSTHTEVEIGSDFVGYRIEALIGRGGMGVVYRAYDLRLKRTVALKLVAPELVLDERFRTRFARESELAMSLEHPNVVPIYDAGEVDGRLYLAMRYVEGTDLGALLRAEGTLDPARALAITGQVAKALDAAHASGLVHRDVKPSNVLLDQSEHVYLGDLGLTRRLEEEGPWTWTGEMRSIGTPAYLAPEQIEGRPVDGRADVYSLGCLLCECLTGQPPFPGRSRLEMAWAHLEEPPPSASERNHDLPEAIDRVIGKALAKAPEDRHPTCAAMTADAEAALGFGKAPALRRRKLTLASMFALVAAAVAAALVVRGNRDATVSVPPVRPNTLVRIDPVTNKVTDVIPVGLQPSETVVGGRSVWVYNLGAGTLSEINSEHPSVRHTTLLSAPPQYVSVATGPVLAADDRGAWLVGVDNEKGFVTRVRRGHDGLHDYRYRLDVLPKAIAIGEGAVWVLGSGSRYEVLRIDPRTGEVKARTRFPASVHLDSLAVGLRGVWAFASSTANVYRIDPRTSRLTAHQDFGRRAGRPEIRFGNVWIPLLDGETLIVNPRTLAAIVQQRCCLDQPTATGYGSTWLADLRGGETIRFERTSQRITATIPVTGSSFWGHPCLSSIAAGAGAVWVSLVRSLRGTRVGRPGGARCSAAWQAPSATSARAYVDPRRAVLTFAINPRDDAIVYASTGSGLFRSTDGGQTWQAANDGLSDAVSTVVIDKNDPATLYAGTQSGVFKSTDAGDSWHAKGLAKVSALLLDSREPTTLYATSDSGLYKSTDAGESWRTIWRARNPLPLTLALDPQRPSILYAGTADGVIKSTDGGLNWSQLGARFVGSLAVDPRRPQTLYASSSDGVLKSRNAGRSWQRIGRGLPNHGEGTVGRLMLDPHNPETLYIGVAGPPCGRPRMCPGGAFKSTNGGRSWRAWQRASSNFVALALDPQNSQTIYAATYTGEAFKSTDGGQTWRELALPFQR